MKTVSVFFMLALVYVLGGCAGGTYIAQQDGTRVSATFVEANAPRVKASLSVSVCPEGTHEASETSGYITHEASLDTDRGRDRYNNGYGYQRESTVRIQQSVGGRKDFTCVPDNDAQEEQK